MHWKFLINKTIIIFIFVITVLSGFHLKSKKKVPSCPKEELLLSKQKTLKLPENCNISSNYNFKDNYKQIVNIKRPNNVKTHRRKINIPRAK